MSKFKSAFRFFVILSLANVVKTFEYDHYKKVKTCQTLSPDGSRWVKSAIQCAVLCSRTEKCVSYSMERGAHGGACYLRDVTLTDINCVDAVYNHFNAKNPPNVYVSPCMHDGIYNNVTLVCRCFYGYVGDFCERLMYDCKEGKESGHYHGLNQMFLMQPPTAPGPFPGKCDMHWYGKTMIMSKEADNSLDFNRGWEDYKSGFGNFNSSHYWLGTLPLHYLTSYRTMKLIVQVLLDQELNGGYWNYRQHIYEGFTVDSEGNNFAIDYVVNYENDVNGGFHALGNCFASQILAPFSTPDKDNDLDGGSNCALTHQSGWWFSACGGCNPTGRIQPMSDTYQNGDPTFMNIPENSNWAPRKIEIWLE